MIVWNWDSHLVLYSMAHGSENQGTYFQFRLVRFLVIGMLNAEDAIPAFWLGLFVNF